MSPSLLPQIVAHQAIVQADEQASVGQRRLDGTAVADRERQAPGLTERLEPGRDAEQEQPAGDDALVAGHTPVPPAGVRGETVNVGAVLLCGLARGPVNTGEDGVVVEEVQKGYKMGDRVIRPSMVVVGSGKPE